MLRLAHVAGIGEVASWHNFHPTVCNVKGGKSYFFKVSIT